MGGDLFRDPTGRLRVGWRLLLFAGLFTALTVAGFAAVPGGGLVAQGGALLGAAVVAGWTLLGFADGRGPGALGFYVSREAPREAAAGLVLGTVLGLASVGVIFLAGGVRWQGEEGSLVSLVGGAAGALGFFALPAAGEEALARGYPLQALAEKWGAGPALLVTSVGFGLLHLGNPGLSALAMVNLVAAGLLLGVIYLRTGSLWWASGAHLGWNWAHGFVADLPVSGLDLVDASLWEGVPAGPSWLGGGSFGPEGSALTTAVVLVAAAALWWGPWLRPGPGARGAGSLAPLPEGRERRSVERGSKTTNGEGS